jgi:hypothetical protein
MNLKNILTAEQIYEFEERAAIMEFDGGLDRRTAEEYAINDIINRYKVNI